jgi:hypothetical protein
MLSISLLAASPSLPGSTVGGRSSSIDRVKIREEEEISRRNSGGNRCLGLVAFSVIERRMTLFLMRMRFQAILTAISALSRQFSFPIIGQKII